MAFYAQFRSVWIRFDQGTACLLIALSCGCHSVSRYSPLASVERAMIYQGADETSGNWQPANIVFEDANFTSSDGTRLHGWLVTHPRPKAVALFLHGNAGNITSRADELQILNQRHGLTIMTFDYRGYGKSEGRPNERGIMADARAARQWLAERVEVPQQDILIFGRSLGGAVAVELATDGALGLVLASTFTSLPDAAREHFPWIPAGLLMTQRMNSLRKISRYTGPLLHSHGTSDRVIPFEHGRKLFEQAGSQDKRFIPIEGAGHNDAPPESYRVALDSFIDSLPQTHLVYR